MQFSHEEADVRDSGRLQGRGRGRDSYRGRVRGRARGSFMEHRGAYRSNVQCHNCKRYGHMKAQCRFKGKEANLVEEEEEVTDLFMVNGDAGVEQGSVWIIDSGCSNHMTGGKALFRELDESEGRTVRLGDSKVLQVARRGTVVIRLSIEKTRLLRDVQYVPHLAHNLLSVGQLLNAGYTVIFSDEVCLIKEK